MATKEFWEDLFDDIAAMSDEDFYDLIDELHLQENIEAQLILDYDQPENKNVSSI